MPRSGADAFCLQTNQWQWLSSWTELLTPYKAVVHQGLCSVIPQMGFPIQNQRIFDLQLFHFHYQLTCPESCHWKGWVVRIKSCSFTMLQMGKSCHRWLLCAWGVLPREKPALARSFSASNGLHGVLLDTSALSPGCPLLVPSSPCLPSLKEGKMLASSFLPKSQFCLKLMASGGIRCIDLGLVVLNATPLNLWCMCILIEAMIHPNEYITTGRISLLLHQLMWTFWEGRGTLPWAPQVFPYGWTPNLVPQIFFLKM